MGETYKLNGFEPKRIVCVDIVTLSNGSMLAFALGRCHLINPVQHCGMNSTEIRKLDDSDKDREQARAIKGIRPYGTQYGMRNMLVHYLGQVLDEGEGKVMVVGTRQTLGLLNACMSEECRRRFEFIERSAALADLGYAGKFHEMVKALAENKVPLNGYSPVSVAEASSRLIAGAMLRNEKLENFRMKENA